MWQTFLRNLVISAASLHFVHADIQQPIQHPDSHGGSYNVAIIGAGAAGSSAAYHLSQFALQSKQAIPINITIFEAESYVGGRTTTVNALNDPRYPLELGGSIFVEVNHILYNATRDFGLSANTHDFEGTGSAYDLGIWDGDTFVFTTSSDDGGRSGLKGTLGNWWDIAKLLWKYGLSPFRLRSLRQDVVGRFLRMYDEVFPFQDLTEVVETVGLLSFTSRSGAEILNEAKVGEDFSRDIIQAATRVNYAQNLDDFHGLETMVSMSTEGAMSIEGGNWRIFDQMIRQSGAVLNLNSSVQEIQTGSKSSTIVYRDGSENEIIQSGFDTIILAAPYNPSALKLTPPPAWQPIKVDYVSQHVTLFATAFRPDPVFFGLEADQQNLVPDSILTTLPPEIDPSFLGRGVEGVGPTGFWSLSTLRIIEPSPGSKLYLYKIFSPEPLSAGFLIDLFGWCNEPNLLPEHMALQYCQNSGPNSSTAATAATAINSSSSSAYDYSTSTTTRDDDDDDNDGDDDPITNLPPSLLPWSHYKRWDSYPYLPPTSVFDCFDIYHGCSRGQKQTGEVVEEKQQQQQQQQQKKEKKKGKLYYTSPIELLISTMETSALSGRNVARLIIDQLEAEVASAKSE